MRRLPASIVLAASLALACREDPQGFMPLKVGQKTVYEVEYSINRASVQRAEAVMRIDETRTIDGNKYFRVVTVVTGVPGHEPEVYYRRFAADGLHEVHYVGDTPVDFLQTPWPLEVGQAWQVNAAGIEMTCRVDVRMPAVLPEKTYDDSYKISCYGTHEGRRFKNQTYLVAGVGPVRIVQEAGEFKMELRLKEGD
ncbi:MAG TPA: hypothetical protein VLE27_15455 [Thermoanaerobaculia bacterium]|nr:hypothetical protein [Thermoanaerobaculia bacterium]